jgi:hypothetical protein
MPREATWVWGRVMGGVGKAALREPCGLCPGQCRTSCDGMTGWRIYVEAFPFSQKRREPALRIYGFGRICAWMGLGATGRSGWGLLMVALISPR